MRSGRHPHSNDPHDSSELLSWVERWSREWWFPPTKTKGQSHHWSIIFGCVYSSEKCRIYGIVPTTKPETVILYLYKDSSSIRRRILGYRGSLTCEKRVRLFRIQFLSWRGWENTEVNAKFRIAPVPIVKNFLHELANVRWIVITCGSKSNWVCSMTGSAVFIQLRWTTCEGTT